MGITQQIGASSIIKPGVIDNTAARPASPYEGQVIFQKDTDQLLVWNGTAWVIPNSPAQNPGGLELVTVQSFTSASSASPVDVSNCFTSTYDNYKIILTYTGTASDYTSFQFRNSGGAVSSSFYRGQVTRSYGTTVDAVSSYNASAYQTFAYSYGSNTIYSTTSCDIVSPNLNTPTAATMQFYCDNATSSVNFVMNGGFMYAAQAVMTGFRVYPGSGNITGSVSVYGYRK